MALDDRATAPAWHGASAHSGIAPGAMRPALPASLVLFVGTPPAGSLCELLAHDGMRSLWLARPAQALRAAALARFDALVIDGGALGGRAASWLSALRAQLACPLVVIAEHADEVDEIVALELGADAYLSRPLAPRRLRAHLAALFRLRSPTQGRLGGAPDAPDSPPVSSGADWHLDRVSNQLFVEGRGIALTEVQAALLQCLAEARGRIVARARLAAALRHGEGLSARSVDVYIHRLRARLNQEGQGSRIRIEAVRGRGYALSCASAADNAGP